MKISMKTTARELQESTKLDRQIFDVMIATSERRSEIDDYEVYCNMVERPMYMVADFYQVSLEGMNLELQARLDQMEYDEFIETLPEPEDMTVQSMSNYVELLKSIAMDLRA